MDDSDDALIRRCQRGDSDAFGVLVKRYAGRATGMAVMLIGNHADALDVSQEAFVRAFRHIRTFKGEANFFVWYSKILRNVCWTWLRRQHKRKDVELLETQALPAAEADPAVLAERNEETERLLKAIMQLPTKHREIIVLSHFQQLKYRQIAEVLEIPIGTVMSRLHAARAALRATFQGDRP